MLAAYTASSGVSVFVCAYGTQTTLQPHTQLIRIKLMVDAASFRRINSNIKSLGTISIFVEFRVPFGFAFLHRRTCRLRRPIDWIASTTHLSYQKSENVQFLIFDFELQGSAESHLTKHGIVS